MKFGHIVMNLVTKISSMFLDQCWGVETSSRPFYDFNEITILRDVLIFVIWFLKFSILPYSPFEKKKEKEIEHWKHDIIGYWVIGVGC